MFSLKRSCYLNLGPPMGRSLVIARLGCGGACLGTGWAQNGLLEGSKLRYRVSGDELFFSRWLLNASSSQDVRTYRFVA